MTTNSPRRLIIGISGASGTVYGVRILELLYDTDIETHLVMSRSAEMTLAIRRLFVRVKTARNARNAQASVLPVHGSEIVRSGRKNIRDSASTPMAAGKSVLAIGPAVQAFQMLMPTPRAKNP